MRGRRGLSQTIEDHLTEWSDRTGITVEVWALPTSRVPTPVADAVYAVIQEALSNVESHSGAHTLSLALTTSRTGLKLTISDNGVGFTPGTRTGRGLDLMKRRFSEVGGTLTINSVVGEGTTITGHI